VLERLRAGSAAISELAEPFGMTPTGMTKHIRMLGEAHLVTTEKVGRVRSARRRPPGSRTSTNGSSDSAAESHVDSAEPRVTSVHGKAHRSGQTLTEEV
jgi:predicted ArsR family transcriptional regulator